MERSNGTEFATGHYMLQYEDRLIAFDSNVLTYFLEGNKGEYSRPPTDPIAEQRIAAVRLFLYCRPFIVPTVRAEAAAILNPDKRDEHVRFIGVNFGETNPDDFQDLAIARRATELLPHHPKGANDCRILAEVEADGGLPVFVTFDGDFQRDLGPVTRVKIQTPVECWTAFDFPHGMPPVWTPAAGHPLATETWWRWE